MKQTWRLWLGLIVVTTLLVGWWFRAGQLLGTAEMELPFYNLDRFALKSEFAWTDFNLGNVANVTTASYPTWWVLASIQRLGVAGWVIEAGVFWLLLIVAASGMFWLTHQLFPELKSRYLVLASLMYWFNPLTLINVWNRFLLNYQWFWGVLPLLLAMFWFGLSHRRWQWALYTSLIVTLSAYALTNLVFVIMLWLCFGLFWLYGILIGRVDWKFGLGYGLILAVSFWLLNNWWISQLLSFLYVPGYRESIESFFPAQDNVVTFTVLSQRLGKLVDLTGLVHRDMYTYGLAWGKWWLSYPWMWFNYLVVGCVFWGGTKYYRSKRFFWLFVGFLLVLFLMKGSNPPIGEVMQVLFTKIPVIQIFRNPFEKFSFILPILMIPLVAYVVSQSKRWLWWVMMLGVVVYWGLPYWTGAVFSRVENEHNYSYQVQPPTDYQALNQWFNQQPPGRYLALPLGDEGITYNWSQPYTGVELSSSLIDRPGVTFNTTIPYYADFVKNLSQYQLSDRLLRFLPLMDAKYILLRKDVNYQARAMANPAVIERELNSWVSQGKLAKVWVSRNFVVYAIPTTPAKIYSTNQLVVSDDRDETVIDQMVQATATTNSAVVNISDQSLHTLASQPLIIQPNRVFSPLTYLTVAMMGPEDIIPRLFYARHLPGEKIYPLIRWREVLESPSKSDPLGNAIYSTGLLGKRAIEIYKLYQANAATDLISQSEAEYLADLNQMLPVLRSLVYADHPVAQVLRDSLMYQRRLLELAHAKIMPEISNYFADLELMEVFTLPESKLTKYTVYQFKVPVDGQYQIWDQQTLPRNLLIDGQNAQLDRPLQLSTGVHEVAIEVASQSAIFQVPRPGLVQSQNQYNLEMPVTETVPEVYQLEFNYQFVIGSAYQLEVFQTGDDPQHPFFSQLVRRGGDTKMMPIRLILPSRVGNVGFQLRIKPADQPDCQPVWWKFKKCPTLDDTFAINLTDIELKSVTYPTLRLERSGTINQPNQTQVKWQKQSPTSYTLTLDKPQAGQEVLVFSELYNNGWVLKSQPMMPASHLLVNGYANGWLIDQAGQYQVELEYSPQYWLEVGYWISGVSLIGIGLMLGGNRWLKKS